MLLSFADLAHLSLLPLLAAIAAAATPRARARALGIVTGILPVGPDDAITDVAGVRVGQTTVVADESVRTGVTVLLPHPGDPYRERVPAAIFVANGFGKLTGISQVQELGTLETPIALTGTLNTFRVADAIVDWVISRPGNEGVDSVSPVVGECNDGYLSDARRRPVTGEHVHAAIAAAASGPVAEGSVGAGTGTRCLGWKGGIGTASRRLPATLGGWTVGVLVQTNFFSGVLTVAGAPVGVELGRYSFKDELDEHEKGSCMMVVATDAPLDARQLRRLAARTPMGLARTGAFASNGSGDYAIAFTAHPGCRVPIDASGVRSVPVLADDDLSPLLFAVVEATEEAVLNSLFAATTVTGLEGHTAEAIPLDRVIAILECHATLRRR
jgi:D-aminopeptidase